MTRPRVRAVSTYASHTKYYTFSLVEIFNPWLISSALFVNGTGNGLSHLFVHETAAIHFRSNANIFQNTAFLVRK